MVSVIITTYKELETLPQALEAILKENVADEILVVAPDKETENLVKEKYPSVKFLKNEKIIKPAGLNLGISQAKGEIIILTDGDVIIEKGSLGLLLLALKKEGVGLACGQPVSLNSRNNLFGYWSYFLTFAAHRLRLQSKFFPASGNLYAFKKQLFKGLSEETMVDDALITQMVLSQGFQVIYLPQAKVFVKYPENFKDWLKQKIRATGGYIEKIKEPLWGEAKGSAKSQKSPSGEKPRALLKVKRKIGLGKMRSFQQEIFEGIYLFFVYPKNLREFFWTILLYLARIYLWFLIFWQIKVRKKGILQLWQRVESTKKIS